MTRSQQYIDILLDHIPKWELREFEHRNLYDQIKEALISTDDLRNKLLTLYKVQGFSDFALYLLWIAERVEKDQSLERSTPEEEKTVFNLFKKAVGEEVFEENISPISSSSDYSTPISPVETTMVYESESSLNSFTTPVSEFTMDSSDVSGSNTDIWGTQATVVQRQEYNSEERSFAKLLETFLEAIQTGNEDRVILLSTLRSECNEMLS